MMSLAQHLRRTQAELRGQYETGWRSHHEELANYLLPRRGRFFMKQANVGGELNNKIINTSPIFAVRTLASGLLSGVTSPSRPWFRLTTNDPDLSEHHSVKEWLDTVTAFIHQILAAGNLYTELPGVYEELGVFGTGAMIIKPDFDDVVRFYPMTAGEYVIAQDERMKITTVYREIYMSVAQVIREFGRDNASEQVKRAWDQSNYNQFVRVGHAIERNDDDAGNFTGLDVDKKFNYRSVHWELTGDQDHKILRQGGHKRFRGLIPRWFTNAEDVYGRSPGMDALGDAKQLQGMEKVKATGLEKMVSPPMVAPAGLEGQNHSVRPGSMTYFTESQNQTIRPMYEVNLPLQHLQTEISMVENRINRSFYVDLFLMLSQSDRRQITAREVDERHEEKLLMLGPVLERLYDDLLDPLVNFVFDQMLEVGILPDPPPEIQGHELRVELISIMAQAQKLVGAAGVDRFVGFVGGMAQMNPSAGETIDTDRVIQEYAEMLGIPARLLTPAEVLKAQREARAQQQQAAQSGAAMQQAAEIAKSASQAEATGPDGERQNMLERALGGMGAGSAVDQALGN